MKAVHWRTGPGLAAVACVVSVHARRRVRPRPLVAIAAGGAGGRVYPALAVAMALRDDGTEVLFLGEASGPEARLVPQHHFPLCLISSVPLTRPLRSVANVASLLRFPLCVLHSAYVLVRHAPSVVLGVGGRTSVPAAVAAVAMGIPLVLYEPAAIMDEANRVLHWVARRTLLAHAEAQARLRFPQRCAVVGPAVRPDVLASVDDSGRLQRRRQQRERLGIVAKGPTGAKGSAVLLVLGGATGCRYLCQAVHNELPALAAVPGLHIWWQTGARNFGIYGAGHAGELRNVHLTPFIEDIGSALAAADLVLSRAGPSTVAELQAAGVPCVLVPSPATEEGQTANAKILKSTGQAVLMKEDDVDKCELAATLLPLLASGTELEAMRRGAAKQAPGTAALARIVCELRNVAGQRQSMRQLE